MTLRRNSENFQAIRAKFESSKHKLSPRSTMKAGKESNLQQSRPIKYIDERVTERLKGPQTEVRSSSGRIKGLSSIASFSSISTFSSNSFLRRKNNTDETESDEMSDNANASAYGTADSTIPYASKKQHTGYMTLSKTSD